EIANWLATVERRALENSGQESRPPVIDARLRHAARIGNGDERRQIVVLGAEGVTHPRSHAGKTVEGEAGRQKVFARAVRVRQAGERVDEPHLVNVFAQSRQKVGGHLPRLPAWPERVGTFDEIAILALKRYEPRVPWHGLIVATNQLGLVVPAINRAAG